MLSFLIQFPLQTFLTFNPNFNQFITEIVLQTIMIILLLTELFTGYFALRTAAKHQVMQFQLQQFSSGRESNKNE
ncbi:transmembrane protein 17B-like [Chrysoperla carnea]|uniref:transmembrane protein 17B-like n=1 Tax=Chrysoperla carnea TaxID=189513 RepID=UPI001D08FFF7|nr:transmembrane protein 17B-like [Chrysoperla carnea]